VDLAATEGEKVRAAGAGIVVVAERIADRGVVTILHANGLRTTYMPVAATVKRGDSVSIGDLIGSVEPTNNHCPATCLHWGLLRARSYLDPLLLIGPGQVRLLPHWAIRS
jgi:murein DD-endopeptidase MepM/ murein hydrolase activator NlpD